jgi:hypothetical protein
MEAKLDKFARAIALIKEARAVVNDLLWSRQARAGVKEVYLLGLLSQIQSLAVSTRADMIVALGAGRQRPVKTPEPESRFLEKLAFYRKALDGPRRGNVVPFDRRRSRADRRRTHTFLARDRRSGIADRRRRTREQRAATG